MALHWIGTMKGLYKKRMAASPNIPLPTTRHVLMRVCKSNGKKVDISFLYFYIKPCNNHCYTKLNLPCLWVCLEQLSQILESCWSLLLWRGVCRCTVQCTDAEMTPDGEIKKCMLSMMSRCVVAARDELRQDLNAVINFNKQQIKLTNT